MTQKIIKIGIIASGLIMVKNVVKAKSPKVISSFIKNPCFNIY